MKSTVSSAQLEQGEGSLMMKELEEYSEIVSDILDSHQIHAKIIRFGKDARTGCVEIFDNTSYIFKTVVNFTGNEVLVEFHRGGLPDLNVKVRDVYSAALYLAHVINFNKKCPHCVMRPNLQGFDKRAKWM